MAIFDHFWGILGVFRQFTSNDFSNCTVIPPVLGGTPPCFGVISDEIVYLHVSVTYVCVTTLSNV